MAVVGQVEDISSEVLSPARTCAKSTLDLNHVFGPVATIMFGAFHYISK